MSSRFTLNFGLRYERFGAPSNTGQLQEGRVMLAFGTGGNFNQRLAAGDAGRARNRAAGTNSFTVRPIGGDWQPRFGYLVGDPLGKSRTVVRGGFGMFYDLPSDNLWQEHAE